MSKCKTGKNVRGFAGGGMLDSAAGEDQSSLLRQLIAKLPGGDSPPKPEPLSSGSVDLDRLATGADLPKFSAATMSMTDKALAAGKDPNAIYKLTGRNGIGGISPYSSAASSFASGIGGRRFASGGEIKETPEQLMARMAAKYGGVPTSTNSQPAPAIVPAPAPAVEQKGGGVIGLIKDRKAQLEKAINGYANGGKIRGPGTSTSDSIQAKVKQTGEPIAVSTGERIVSKEQDALLQNIARGMGYDSLDALLEQGTGKPVGPTIKGGVAHAATGKLIEERDFSIPLDEQAKGGQAVAQKMPYVPPVVETPIKRNEILYDASARAADPEAAASAGPMVKPIVTGYQGDAGRGKVNPPLESSISQGYAGRGSINPPLVGQIRPDGSDPRFTPDAVQPGMRSGQITIGAPSGAISGTSTVDATRLKAPDGGGYITNASGKAMYLTPQATPPRDPNKTYDAHGNDMTYTNEMKAQLAQMQHDRMVRDTGADIKDPNVRLAAQQQLAQLGKDQAVALMAGKDSRDAVTAGLDQKLKGQQIMQMSNADNLQQNVLAGDKKAIEAWNRIHPQPQEEFGAIAIKDTDPTTGAVSERLQPYSKRTGQAPAALQKTSVPQFTKEDVADAIKKGAPKEAVIKRIKDSGGNPKDFGL